MAGKAFTMAEKLSAVLMSDLEGVSVREVCRQLEISPTTFYKWKNRYERDGPGGLEPRSRRPHRSPNAICADVEDRIVGLRKELPLDAGPATIRYALERDGLVPLPSEATIWRVLRRRGLVVAEPKKRPRSSWQRFVFAEPNGCWQMDATTVALADGVGVEIVSALDDHSRLVVGSKAFGVANSAAVADVFRGAYTRWGLPEMLLSDNAFYFTGRVINKETEFEKDLRRLGVVKLNSGRAHPQTCGKIERWHQTLKKWLRSKRPARSLAELQHELDAFCNWYNTHRPHRALTGATPAETWHAKPPAQPSATIPTPHTIETATRIADAKGRIHIHSVMLSLGTAWAYKRTLIIRNRNDIICLAGKLVDRRQIDPTHRYQPLANKNP